METTVEDDAAAGWEEADADDEGVRSDCSDAPGHPQPFTSAYQTLGLEPTVGLGDIKAAYRRLAQLYHPTIILASPSRPRNGSPRSPRRTRRW